MAQRQPRPGQDRRPRAKSPAERAEEAADVQRRLKREAADRRQAAAAKSSPTARRDAGSPGGHAGTAGRRRTP
jgi:hypothetical protein